MAELGTPTSSISLSGRRRRRWKLVVLALLFGSLLGILLLEITFRVYVAARGWTPNCYRPQPQLVQSHPVNGYELRPGFEFRSATTHISINSHGLRSEEPTGQKPLLVTLGGSAAFGYLVSNEETASALLEEMFREQGLEIDVQNGGVPGYNLNQTLVRFRERIAPLEPDYVLLYLGWNDTPYIVSDDPDAPRFQRGESPAAWKRWLSYSTLYGFIRSRLPSGNTQLVPPVSVSVTPTEKGGKRFHENLNRLADEVRELDAELIVCCPIMAAHPEVREALYGYLSEDPKQREALIALGAWLHAELERFANERGAIWIDGWRPPTEAFLGDAIHLTKTGEAMMAELWFQSLRQHGIKTKSDPESIP
ncbi:MAG: hypothetical protein HUJ26_07830 [Planctomycetaceae bacterium]|nr:hypothetical protein [Planctomycetaceae bacterium]